MTLRRNIIPLSMQNIYDRYHYAPGVAIGDILYCSGQVGRDADLNVIADPEEQFRQAFRNVGIVLNAAGCTFGDAFELDTWFTTFPGDLALFMMVKDEFFTGPNYPTWTGFGVTAFSMPGILVEIKVTALIPDGSRP